MLLQEVKKLTSAEESQRFALSKLVGVRPVIRCRHENAFGRPLIVHCAKKVSDSRNTHSVGVPFRLNNDFPSANWVWIKCYGIHAAVATSLRDFYLSSIATKFLLKN